MYVKQVASQSSLAQHSALPGVITILQPCIFGYGVKYYKNIIKKYFITERVAYNLCQLDKLGYFDYITAFVSWLQNHTTPAFGIKVSNQLRSRTQISNKSSFRHTIISEFITCFISQFWSPKPL